MRPPLATNSGKDRPRAACAEPRAYDHAATRARSRSRDDQTAIWCARERGDAALDLVGFAQSIGLSSTPSDPAALWMTANWLTLDVEVASERQPLASH